jgi:hypothetical protein
VQQTGVQSGPAYPAGWLGRLQDMVTFRALARRRRERKDREVAPLLPLRTEPQLAALAGLPDAAAVGCGLDQLWRHCPRGMATLEEAYLRGQCYLHPRDWELCRQMIVAELSTALRLPADAAQAAVTILDPLSTRMCEFVDRAAETWARRLYARGLVLGVIASMGLMGGLGAGTLPVMAMYHKLAGGSAALSSGEVIAVRDALGCILGGSAGAVVSVLFRLRRIRWLDYEVMDARTAWYRIVTGWFFALGVLFLVKGGIVTVFRDPSGDLLSRGATSGEWVSSWFFWGGVGFLAGLNESWTKNLFSRDSLAEHDERKATARRP